VIQHAVIELEWTDRVFDIDWGVHDYRARLRRVFVGRAWIGVYNTPSGFGLLGSPPGTKASSSLNSLRKKTEGNGAISAFQQVDLQEIETNSNFAFNSFVQSNLWHS